MQFLYKMINCKLANITATRKSADKMWGVELWPVSGRINQLDVLHKTWELIDAL